MDQLSRATLSELVLLPPDCLELPALGSPPFLAFHGRLSGIAAGADDTVWVSDSQSAAIWHVDADGTPNAVVQPAARSVVRCTNSISGMTRVHIDSQSPTMTLSSLHRMVDRAIELLGIHRMSGFDKSNS